MVMPQFGNIPGLPTGSRPFAPPLTSEQLMQAGMDPRAYYGDQYAARAAAMAGEAPAENLRSTAATPMGPRAPQPGVGQQIQTGLKEAKDKGQRFLNRFMEDAAGLPMGRIGTAAGMISPVMTAIGEAQEGRPTGAVGALGGGALGALGGAAIGRAALGGLAAMPGIPGLIGKVGQAALPVLGGMLGAPTGAQTLESVRQKITNEPTKGKEGEFATQMAMNRQMAELGTTQYRDQMGVYTSSVKDLSKFYADQDYYNLQRNMPLINQLKNADLVRQQALINTQNQAYLQQGVVATAGQLATGAQAEAGANLRTALTSNPYAGSVLQAPSISYGR